MKRRNGEAFEEAYARALCERDPAEALLTLSKQRRWTAELRSRLRDAALRQRDGVELAGLLLARLRFERLLRGAGDVEDFFDARPEELTHLFERYHREVPPKTFFPAAEARAFRAWLRAQC